MQVGLNGESTHGKVMSVHCNFCWFNKMAS